MALTVTAAADSTPAPAARRPGLLRTGIITTVGKVLTAGLQMATGILVARWLGVTGRGQYMLAISFNTLAIAVAGLGIGQASIYVTNNQRVPISQVSTALAWISCLWCPVYSVLMWCIYRTFAGYFGDLPNHVMVCLAVGGSLPIAIGMFTPQLLAELRGASVVFVELSQVLAQLALAGGLAATGLLTIDSALLLPLVGGVVGVVAVVRLVWRHLDSRFRPTVELLGKLISYGARMAALNIAYLAHLTVPTLLLKNLADGFSSVGFYTTAVSVCGMVAVAGTATNTLLFSAWANEPERERRARQAELATRLLTMMAFVMAAFTALFAHYIILFLYGDKFTPAAPYLRILVINTVVQLIANGLQNLLYATGKANRSTVIFVITFSVNICLTLLLVPRISTMGAVIATTIASVVFMSLSLREAVKFHGVRLSHCFVPHREDLRLLLRALLPRSWSRNVAPPA